MARMLSDGFPEMDESGETRIFVEVVELCLLIEKLRKEALLTGGG